MTLPAAVIMGLAAQCAPNVAPATIAAIVQTESRGFEPAIGVNGLARQPAPARASRKYLFSKYFCKRRVPKKV